MSARIDSSCCHTDDGKYIPRRYDVSCVACRRVPLLSLLNARIQTTAARPTSNHLKPDSMPANPMKSNWNNNNNNNNSNGFVSVPSCRCRPRCVCHGIYDRDVSINVKFMLRLAAALNDHIFICIYMCVCVCVLLLLLLYFSFEDGSLFGGTLIADWAMFWYFLAAGCTVLYPSFVFGLLPTRNFHSHFSFHLDNPS